MPILLLQGVEISPTLAPHLGAEGIDADCRAYAFAWQHHKRIRLPRFHLQSLQIAYKRLYGIRAVRINQTTFTRNVSIRFMPVIAVSK